MYKVTTKPAGGGMMCPNQDGETRQCRISAFEDIKTWATKMMTFDNFMLLLYALIVIALLKGVFSTLREFFGGGGGGGRVTIVS